MDTKSDIDHLDSVAELIWNGMHVEDDSHLEQLRNRFLSRLSALEDPDSIEKGMKCCKNPQERIQFVQNYFEWVDIPSRLVQRLEKNAGLSTKLREKANAEYKAGNLTGARRGYNLAVAFGRPGDEELGLAFANRSALFLHIKEPQLALRDIELALQNSFPSQLQSKLAEREKKCRACIENQQIQGQEQQDGRSEEEIFCESKFFKLKKPSKSIVGAEDFVRLTNTPGRGRCLTVSGDVKAGSPILVEKPYVTMLEKELHWDMEHCQHCIKRILGGLPCPHCTFAVYCDEQCRTDAATYHQYEHKIWGYLHSIETSRRDLLATRIVAKLGPLNLYKLYGGDDSMNVKSEENNDSVPGFDQNNIYDSTKYSPIYHLVAHRDGQELYDEVSHAFKALLLTCLLKQQSDFFTHIKDTFGDNVMNKSEDELFTFTASIILRHLESIPYNAISLSELQWDGTEKKQMNGVPIHNYHHQQENSIKSVCYASAIFGLLAMSNHSCTPNAAHVRKGGGQLTALVALRNLAAQEEVCITYGPLFTVHPLDQRQSTLKEKYNFNCDCEACVNRWVISDSLAETISPKILMKLPEYEETLKQVHQLVNQNDLITAMVGLLPCLQYFGSHYPRTFSLTQVAQDLFKKALVRMANSTYVNFI